METAEFTVEGGIDHKPAFNWWVKYMIKKRDRIIASFRKQQTRYLKRSHQLNIELPKAVEQALALDTKNGSALQTDPIFKEMDNVRNAYNVLPDRKKVPIGQKFV